MKMRFSLQAFGATSRQEWIDLAKKAEDLGCSMLVTADHLDQLWSPLAPLVTVAEHTSLRVGVMVLNNDLRHPAMLAREAAAIDLLTDGRLELGLGAGHGFPEYERIGLPFDPAPVRVDRLEESVQIVRRLLDGDTVHFDGVHYHLAGETTYPRPAQGHVPIMVGGGGSRVLRLAATRADIVGFAGAGRTKEDGKSHETTGFPTKAVDAQVELVRDAAAAAGRSGDSVPELQALVQAAVVTDDPPATAADMVARFQLDLTVDDILETPYIMVGTAEGLIDKLLAAAERWGISHYTIRPDTLDGLTPVLAALAGREC
jgi:probable F420-dependent oxidoreductase